eukprot:7376419-Prymnesium_polylepis.4
MGRADPPHKSRRKSIGRKYKASNKNRDPLALTEKRIETRIARDQAKLAEIRAKKNAKTPARAAKRARAEPVPDPVTKVARTKESEADQRVAIRYIYRRLDSPPERRRRLGRLLRNSLRDLPAHG